MTFIVEFYQITFQFCMKVLCMYICIRILSLHVGTNKLTSSQIMNLESIMTLHIYCLYFFFQYLFTVHLTIFKENCCPFVVTTPEYCVLRLIIFFLCLISCAYTATQKWLILINSFFSYLKYRWFSNKVPYYTRKWN